MNHEELLKWAKKLDQDVIFSYSKSKDISAKERKFVYQVAGKLRDPASLSFKQLNYLFEIVGRIREIEERSVELAHCDPENALNGAGNIRHLCLRLAWHDNKWNGCVCRSPVDNTWCVGEHSLLSERIRKRRNLDIECRQGVVGKAPDREVMDGYQPPCFWSINAFGKETLTFEHDNPVMPEFPPIRQIVPPYTVISWPFKLSFVKNAKEHEQYGNYYPKEIFENRIKRFRESVTPGQSLVFLYCKFSNPVSGEDMDYLVAGCALLKEQSEPEWFDVTDEELDAACRKLKQPNFPSMNWALGFTTDFEHTGVRIPYHEYLDLAQREGGISDDLIQDIAVTSREPELRDGFSYVARHVDDDQAIYLLMKIRRSILMVREHGLLQDYNVKGALENIEFLLEMTWQKRGYLPGLRNLLFAVPGLVDDYGSHVDRMLEEIDLSEVSALKELLDAIEQGHLQGQPDFNGLFDEISEFLDEHDIEPAGFLRLASLNLTSHQFRKIIIRRGLQSKLDDVCDNPYLLAEEYVPDDDTEHDLTGEKIDGVIDFFKIDIGLFPHARYLPKDRVFHNWKVTDRRRIRAVIINILEGHEHRGDCFLEADFIQKELEGYPLFYKSQKEYRFKENLTRPASETKLHFKEKLVIKNVGDSAVYYLKRLYDAETYVADCILQLLGTKPYQLNTDSLEQDLDESIASLSERIGRSFDSELFLSERNQLYKTVLNHAFSAVTGFPGSGKSYELLKLIRYFNEIGETHLVLSLTGKSVLRLRNNEEGFEGVNAKTIDRFLNESKRVDAQGGAMVINNLIIDESSMIDLPRLREVLEHAGLEKGYLKRLILVGDENQLPPIGFGKPYADILNYLASHSDKYGDHLIRLESNCRAELDNSFLDFTGVFSGDNKSCEPQLAAMDRETELCNGGVSLRFWRNKTDLYKSMDAELTSLLRDDDGRSIDISEYLGISEKSKTAPTGLEKYQVLSPNRTGFYGASGLNLHFQEDLRKSYPYGRGSGETALKLLDKVMHTENEYMKDELFVSNGSMGGIIEDGKVFFLERDNPVHIKDLRKKDALELAYAITVHKSQGSGFDLVHVVLPARKRFVSRELLYTALTRTRKKITIFVQEPDEDYSVAEYFRKVRYTSDILQRRTSLLNEAQTDYAYNPEEGVFVKSRVEYIIYKKLMEYRLNSDDFRFRYEEPYPIDDEDFDLHPDFVLRFSDGRVIYWEHLGRVNSRSYLRSWDQRRHIYEKRGDLPNVITTDELHGINDGKIDKIIDMLVKNEMQTEDSSKRYSDMHFSLR